MSASEGVGEWLNGKRRMALNEGKEALFSPRLSLSLCHSLSLYVLIKNGHHSCMSRIFVREHPSIVSLPPHRFPFCDWVLVDAQCSDHPIPNIPPNHPSCNIRVFLRSVLDVDPKRQTIKKTNGACYRATNSREKVSSSRAHRHKGGVTLSQHCPP